MKKRSKVENLREDLAIWAGYAVGDALMLQRFAITGADLEALRFFADSMVDLDE